MDELIDIYISNKSHSHLLTKLSDKVYVSGNNHLSLQEYITVCKQYCSHNHHHPCSECTGMSRVAELVLEHGFYPLSAAFRSSFPSTSYSSATAKRKVLQMPIAAITIGEPCSGKSEVYLMEAMQGFDYQRLIDLLESTRMQQTSSPPNLSKEEMKQLLSFATSNREREVLRYSVSRVLGLTSSAARRMYGWEGMSQRSSVVEDSLQEFLEMRKNIDDLCLTQDRALLMSFGIESNTLVDSPSDESEEDDKENDGPMVLKLPTTSTNVDVHVVSIPSTTELNEILKQSHCNWFELVDTVLQLVNGDEEKEVDEEEVIKQLNNYYVAAIESCSFSSEQCRLINQSHEAFVLDGATSAWRRSQAAALNGEIVTDSDIEDCEQYVGLKSLQSEQAKAIIMRRRQQIGWRARYMKTKMLAERKFLARKQSASVRGILKDFPNIGKKIEEFVQERNVGADAWRHTGVLTFDGNTKVKQKVTYTRIKEYLESVYNRKFSFGTIVQLCVARNKRRKSASRYKGVAHVTCRRARKGFQLRFNPDSHWSNALYRGLNILQYVDGRHILLINRDDAAGFRLDTMATHRLQRTPMVQGCQALTTYTDYVNRYPSILQTTSYNFTGTNTTSEVCVGIVKASGLFPKNPAQHAADIEFLQRKPELKPIFMDPINDVPKRIVCVRVDGASDEGPSHEEVQFFWTLHHINTPSIVTLVSARNSGASYLNRVELQNGCQALAHANLFIPSTLGGSCIDSKTGKVDPEKFKQNMLLATEVYINRVNGAPCGEGNITLYRGADSDEYQKMRPKLLQFLKGSKQQKQKIRQQEPDIFAYLESIWTIRNEHMQKDLPIQYLFHLVCCLKSTCSHPLCKVADSSNIELPRWFPGGPFVSYLPLPILDPGRPWGSMSCSDCNGTCFGHYMQSDVAMFSPLSPARPPSVVMKEMFKKIKGCPTDDQLQEIGKKVSLSPEHVRMWVEHLQTVAENRRRGAQKAAAKHKKNKIKKSNSHDVYLCGVCHDQYMEFTEEEEDWIQCDGCAIWFHFICVGITTAPDSFFCDDCV